MKSFNSKGLSMFLLVVLLFIAAPKSVKAPGEWYDCDYSITTCSYCGLSGEGNFQYCTTAGVDDTECWIRAGEIVGEYPDTTTLMCCGDDSQETFSRCSDNDDGSIYWDSSCSSDNAACCSADSCVDPFTLSCVGTSTYHYFDAQTDDKYAFCNSSNIWRDCDDNIGVGLCDESVCGDNSDVEAGEDNVGEYTGIGSTGCCGDDDEEYYRNGLASLSTGKCCNALTDCVNSSGSCVATGSFDAGEYCNNGVWSDQDYSVDLGAGVYEVPNCEFVASDNVSGFFNCDNAGPGSVCDDSDNDPLTGYCCGDDMNEYYKDNSSTGGGKACCSDDSYCADAEGRCRGGIEEYGTNNLDGDDTCGDGIDNDCDGKTDTEELEDCPSCGNGECWINENGVEENAFNCPQDCMGLLAGWSFSDPAQVNLTDYPTKSRSYSLHMFGPVNVSQELTDLAPGSIYVVFAYVSRLPNENPQIRMVVDDGNGNNMNSTDFVKPDTEWEPRVLELEYSVPENGMLRVILEKSSEPGSIFVDDIAVIEKTYDVGDKVPYVDSNYIYGCCDIGECWNGFECQNLTDLHSGFNESPVPVCVDNGTDAVWQLPYKKEHWYKDINYIGEKNMYKYCPLDDQCWQSGMGDPGLSATDKCLKKGEFPQGRDLFCDPYTTRTSLLAANILNISKHYDGSETNHDNYTLICDSARCFEWNRNNDDKLEKCKYAGLNCIYKSGDTLIGGFILDNNIPDTDSVCLTGPNYYKYDYETDHPDSNPKCYFQEILGLRWGYGNDPDVLLIKFYYEPYFTKAFLSQSADPAVPNNNHKIKSIGWNNATKIVIFSNKDLDYNLLGEGMDNSIIKEELESWKKYENGSLLLPSNVMGLANWFFLADEDFDTILISKNDQKNVEALIETKNDPFNYFGFFYDNISSQKICENLNNSYLSSFGGHSRGVLQYRFYCENKTDSTHSFIGCGSELQKCEEARVYQTSELQTFDNKFENYVWNDLTRRFRNFTNCMMNHNYNILSIPEYYKNDIINEEEFIPYNNRQSEGCCPTEKCWNGFGCVDKYELFEYNETKEPKFVCLDDGWNLGYLRYDWDRDKSNYCAFDYQCYVSEVAFEKEFDDFEGFKGNLDKRYCTKTQGFFYRDHYCLAGNWTTRTGLLAAAFLNFTSSGVVNFTLFCDNYTNTLNVIDFTPIEDGRIDYYNYLTSNATNNFCVLKYYDTSSKVAFGTSLNNNTDISDFLENILGLNGDECDDKGAEDFDDCLGNEILWWNNKTKIVVYNKDGMKFGQKGFLEKLWEFLLDPIRVVVNWVKNVFVETTVSLPGDFDKFYTLKSGTKKVWGVVVEKEPGNYVLVSYEDFSTNISESMIRRDPRINISSSGNVYKVTSLIFDVLYKDWTALTAKTRVK